MCLRNKPMPWSQRINTFTVVFGFIALELPRQSSWRHASTAAAMATVIATMFLLFLERRRNGNRLSNQR